MSAAGQPPAGAAPAGSLDWGRERASWPHARHSRFQRAGGLTWHVQRMGDGPPALLVHGTGASAHSWHRLAPILAERYTVIAPDLPGHGFTERAPRGRMSLPAMAAAVASLVDALGVRPALAVGHSAGAAIVIRCCLDGTIRPGAVVSINGALLPFRGAAGVLFPPLARLLFLNPLAPRIFARRAEGRDRVERLIHSTGSVLDAAGIDYYARLFRSPGHVAAALGMMAHWDLQGLMRDLPDLDVPLLLIAGDGDDAVSPDEAVRVADRVRGARLSRLPGLGHLAHEEDPEAVAAPLLEFAQSTRRTDDVADAGGGP